MKVPFIAVAIVVLAAPGLAHGQFTTVVSPPPRETVAPPGEPQPARVDTTRRITLGEMQAWVDSVAIESRAGRDTARAVEDTAALFEAPAPAAGRPLRAPETTTRFEEGAPAPDTATPFPLLLLIGAGAAGLGAALLRRRDDA